MPQSPIGVTAMSRTFLRSLSLALTLATICALPSAAQTIRVRGDGALRVQVAPSAKIAVPVTIDMSSASGANVASLTTGVSWAASRLTLDSVKAGAFGTLTSNTANAGTGSISLSTYNNSGATGTVTFATMYFTAGTAGGT